MPETQTPTKRDQAYFDIFVTALEGGIGYWSNCKRYHWTNDQGATEDLAGYHADIYDVESPIEEGPLPEGATGAGRIGEYRVALYRIDRAVIAKGVGAFGRYFRDAASTSYTGRARRDLAQGHWDHLDIDAGIADSIVQLGLFGDVIYG